MKINAPKLKILEEKNFFESLTNGEFSNGHFKENVTQSLLIENYTFDTCLMEKIDFSSIELIHVDLVDVIFDGCDLSNKNFDEQLITRVVFRNCKMMGTSFIHSSLKDVRFENCIIQYANFANTKFSQTSFFQSSITDSSFLEGIVKELEFTECKLYGSEFIQTKLKGIDFSTNDIYGTNFDFISLKGIIVDPFQCQHLIGMLGVMVKE